MTSPACRVCLASLLAVAPALAHAPQTGGAARVGPAPASLEPGAAQSDERILVFVEREGVILETALRLDRGPQRDVPIGTRVSSVFVHFDPSTAGASLSGEVTFDEEVLGVMLAPVSLDATDGALGRATATYPKNSPRGVEDAEDAVAIDGQFTVRVSLREDGDGVDQVRIVTRAEPAGGGCHCATAGTVAAPGALALMLLACARRRSGRR